MAETVIRPTLKFVYLGYFLVIVVVVGAVLAFTRFPMPSAIPSSWQPWIPWASLVLLIWPVRRHLRNRLTKMTILDDKLRYERGFFNRSTRTIPLAKVQDVTTLADGVYKVTFVSEKRFPRAEGSWLMDISAMKHGDVHPSAMSHLPSAMRASRAATF